MLILGIDTSCDDTAAAIVEDGRRIVSNVVSSQDEVHRKYGGVVPELASRRHVELLWPVVSMAMERAGIDFDSISAVAVTGGPGLIGSLLVGVCFGKALSFAKKLPLISVNHLEGHIHAVFLEASPGYPFIALVVSGGHTSIYRIDGFGAYRELGRTRDDAAGEAFDKVAKLLGFGYPGGPVINKVALSGNPDAVKFPRAWLPGTMDFSFSGLKTAVLNYYRNNPSSSIEDIAASFQASVVDVLTKKVFDAARSEGLSRIVLSGGVSANSALREAMEISAVQAGVDLFLPSIGLCTDNAAMIAAVGYHYYTCGCFADYTLNPKSYLPLGSVDD